MEDDDFETGGIVKRGIGRLGKEAAYFFRHSFCSIDF